MAPPPPTPRLPPDQAASPGLTSVRPPVRNLLAVPRSCSPPAAVNGAAPLRVPPVQVVSPLTVTAPGPVSVPPERVRDAGVAAALKVVVPPDTTVVSPKL